MEGFTTNMISSNAFAPDLMNSSVCFRFACLFSAMCVAFARWLQHASACSCMTTQVFSPRASSMSVLLDGRVKLASSATHQHVNRSLHDSRGANNLLTTTFISYLFMLLLMSCPLQNITRAKLAWNTQAQKCLPQTSFHKESFEGQQMPRVSSQERLP